MRRLLFVICAVFAAALVVSLTTLSAKAQTGEQYEASDGAEAPQEPSENTTPESTTPESTPNDKGAPDRDLPPDREPGPQQVIEEVSRIDEDPYFEVVDNDDEGSFAAPGWRKENAGDAGAIGGDYVSAPAGGAKAVTYDVNVPEDGAYSVYARWPVGKDNATAARFVVPTSSGPRSDVVDQRADAGFWVMIGAFEMEKGTRTIRIEDGGEGTAVIDAVMVVQDAVIAPNGDTASVADPEALAPVAGGETTASRMSTSDRAGSSRSDVVRVAKSHLKTPYGTRICRRGVREDCSCHTRLVYKKFGYLLPDSPGQQWQYGQRVSRSNLALGDLVFHDLDNSGRLENNFDDHVSIWAGNGYIIHASSYFNKVVRSQEKYLPHYHGAKRLRLR